MMGWEELRSLSTVLQAALGFFQGTKGSTNSSHSSAPLLQLTWGATKVGHLGSPGGHQMDKKYGQCCHLSLQVERNTCKPTEIAPRTRLLGEGFRSHKRLSLLLAFLDPRGRVPT